MSSYYGSFEHAVDPKGRVVVPSSFRDEFRDGGHLSLRRDHIGLYDPQAWQAFVAKLRDLRDLGSISRPSFNQVMALSPPITPDSQGRFGLPARLRESAGIANNVVFVGVDDYLGIYSPETAPLPVGDDFDALMDVIDGLPL